jgi:hypothetical protein
MKIERITIKRGISRGRDTYGYNIVTAVSNVKSYRCMGGGYDMLGTVMGDWFAAEHQAELVTLADGLKPKKYGAASKSYPDYYGLYADSKGSLYIDGACGLECVNAIIRACGYKIETCFSKRGWTEAFLIYKEQA